MFVCGVRKDTLRYSSYDFNTGSYRILDVWQQIYHKNKLEYQ